MNLSVGREALLQPLQAVIGVVERRQTMPILANVLLSAQNGQLSVTATDLEVELVATVDLDIEAPGDVTVPGRKLLDICRALPEGATIKLSHSAEKMTVRSGRSRFTLATLPAAEFPTIDDINAGGAISLPQETLQELLEKTHFAMAQQDVRYYLNGLLIETGGQHLRAVATDGHRLAMCQVEIDGGKLPESQVIVPRKGVLELQRLLHGEGDLSLHLGSNHVRIQLDGIRFTSKLIDGRFPEYDRVIPKNPGNELIGDRDLLKGAMQRTAILSNEKYRGIRLMLDSGGLKLQAHNPEQEEAEEEVELNYNGDDMEIGFNVNYLLDALAAVDGKEVSMAFVDANASCLIRDPGNENSKYVVMPMRL